MAQIPNATATSADEGRGIDELKERIMKLLHEHKRTLPKSDDDYSPDYSGTEALPAYIPML
jgi:predicted GTPase